MSFSVKYNLSNENIRRLELISQSDGNLQVLRMNPDWSSMLEAKARLREAVSSIGVEGTVVTMDQAKAITTGDDKVKIGEKERREFVSYYKSLEYIKKQVDQPLSLKLLLRIHELITNGDNNANPGKIRSDSRSVERNNKIVYTAPPPNQLSFLLNEFIKWFNQAAHDKQLSPVIAAGICHLWFVWIHPFCDGNGRTARLLTTFLLLKKKSEGIKYFALSDYYNRQKKSYYDALQKSNPCNPQTPSMNFNSDMTYWLTFFIQSYLAQMREVREVTNRILQLNIRVEHLRKSGLITERHSKALSFLLSHEKVSYDELQEHLNVTKQRVHQILQPLRDAHILVEERIGSKKWFKLGSPEDEPDETVFKKKLKSKKQVKTKKTTMSSPKQAVLPIFPG